MTWGRIKFDIVKKSSEFVLEIMSLMLSANITVLIKNSFSGEDNHWPLGNSMFKSTPLRKKIRITLVDFTSTLCFLSV
jgi:hypothetical protein